MSTLQRVMLWFFKTKFSGFQYNREIFFSLIVFMLCTHVSNHFRNIKQTSYSICVELADIYYYQGGREGMGTRGGLEGYNHRRIELEDKAKVVLSDWGQNLCRASCFASVFFKRTFELDRLFLKD